MSVDAFCIWLSNTPVSQFIQTTAWIIPAVQTVHILCIASVISAAFLIHLHTLGLAMRSDSSAALAKRFFPWLWWALVLLLLSGTILIVAEPLRSLRNSVFVLKMALVTAAVVLTLLYQQPLRSDPSFWEKTPARRMNASAIAVASLLVWVSVVFAGRWIAYAINS